MRKADYWGEEVTNEIHCQYCLGIGDCECDEDTFKELCMGCGELIERCICSARDQAENDIYNLLLQAQQLLNQAEAMVEYLSAIDVRRPELESTIDASQHQLVAAHLALGKNDFETLHQTNFIYSHKLDDCKLTWLPQERLLSLYIPESWERVNTRPSLYIKDIRRYHNAAEVGMYYTELIQKILLQNKKVLGDWATFESCYVGVLFHFKDRYIRDPDNFMIKALVDAAKNARVFKVDNYRKMMYMAGAVHDPNRSGMTLNFSDTVSSFEYLIGYTEVFKEQKTILRLP